jgi:hypothetical protein
LRSLIVRGQFSREQVLERCRIRSAIYFRWVITEEPAILIKSKTMRILEKRICNVTASLHTKDFDLKFHPLVLSVCLESKFSELELYRFI